MKISERLVFVAHFTPRFSTLRLYFTTLHFRFLLLLHCSRVSSPATLSQALLLYRESVFSQCVCQRDREREKTDAESKVGGFDVQGLLLYTLLQCLFFVTVMIFHLNYIHLSFSVSLAHICSSLLHEHHPAGRKRERERPSAFTCGVLPPASPSSSHTHTTHQYSASSS